MKTEKWEQLVREQVVEGTELRHVGGGRIDFGELNRASTAALAETGQKLRRRRSPDGRITSPAANVCWYKDVPNAAVVEAPPGATVRGLSGDGGAIDPTRWFVSLDRAAVVCVRPPAAAAHPVFVVIEAERTRASSTGFGVAVYEATRPAAPSTDLRPVLPTVDLDRDLLRGDLCAEPLRAAVTPLLEAPSPVDKLAGLGLLARLWYPADDAARRSLLERSSAEASTPPERIRAWAREHLAALAPDLDDLAAPLCGDLFGIFDTLEGGLDDQHGSALLAAKLLHDRDHLESVAYILRVARGGPAPASALDAALARLDERARLARSIFDCLDDEFWHGVAEDWRFEAVSWREPAAWWGTLAVAD